LLRPFVSELGEIREEIGADQVRRQMAEERSAALERELEILREARESPEMVGEEPESTEQQPHAANTTTKPWASNLAMIRSRC
jgi:hypothetical protein